jgi:hypothetical protein
LGTFVDTKLTTFTKHLVYFYPTFNWHCSASFASLSKSNLSYLIIHLTPNFE